MRHGGASNRSGSQFVGEVKDSTKSITFMEFVFNNDQTYVLEFGDQYMRPIRLGVNIFTGSAQTISAVTQADPAVVTITGHPYSNGDEIYISLGDTANGADQSMVELHNRNFKVANVTTNTFELQYMDSTDVDATGFTAYDNAVGSSVLLVYEISTPYLEADLDDLQFVQSADVITIVHPSYAPRTLSRNGHDSWTLSTITFAPLGGSPTSLISGGGGAGSNTYKYTVTEVNIETGEEGLVTSTTTIVSRAIPTVSVPINITWSTTVDVEYNVYRYLNDVPGLLGVARGGFFDDIGVTPDTTITPPSSRTPFTGADNYPSSVAYFQQRIVFANTNNDPEKVWTSRIGQYNNLSTSSPLRADDAVTFSIVGRQVNSVKHMIDLGKLITFTTSGEWTIGGDSAGILTPTEINPRQHSYNGSKELSPIVINDTALYLQARGSIIRDLGFDFNIDGYTGNDLGIFSSHLFDNYTITDWSFQQVPHSILWVVRDDGILLGLTYVKEHQVLAWHRHDFDGGLVKKVSVVPEGDEDVLYVAVERTIDSRTVTYIERMSTRKIDEVIDNTFLDSHLSYDGRNIVTSQTVTLSGGTNWTYTETLVLTSSFNTFKATDIGNAVHITLGDDIVKCNIVTYTSATVVGIKPHKTVPVAMRNAALSTFSKAVDELLGLWHLEGKSVSVFADEFVVASPKNAEYDTVTVTNGKVTLDKPYSVIHVGLPYISDIESLNIDTAKGETLVDKELIVKHVSIFVEDSRGLFVGPKPPSDDDVDPIEDLTEIKVRNVEDYDSPISLVTGIMDVNIQPEWNSNGRVFIRQIDPIPVSVLAIAPAGDFPFRG